MAEEKKRNEGLDEINSVSRGSEAAQANKKQKLIKSLLINSLCLSRSLSRSHFTSR